MRTLILLLALPVLAGFGDPDFGKVVDQNVAAMAGPLPDYAGVPLEGSNGVLAARAVNRYQRGETKPLTIPRTTGIGGLPTVEANPGGGSTPVVPQ